MTSGLRTLSEGDRARVLIDEMHYLRGRCAGCFAHVEFMLGDLCHRVGSLAEYREICLILPYKFEKRVAKAKEIAARPGRVAPYQTEIERVAEAISDWVDFRNHMAHGFIRLEATPDRSAHQFRSFKYSPQPEAPFHSDEMLFNIVGMRVAADELTDLTEAAAVLLERLYRELDI